MLTALRRDVPCLRSVPLSHALDLRQETARSGFATVHQDGGDEGILLLTRMPNADQAATLRNYVGLRQTRDVGPDHGSWLHRKAI